MRGPRRCQPAREGCCGRDAGGRPRDCDGQVVDHDLARDAPGRRAQRASDDELGLSRPKPSERKRRQVRQGDEEHCDRAQTGQQERLPSAVDQTVAKWNQAKGAIFVRSSHIALEHRRGGVGAPLGLLERHTGHQPRNRLVRGDITARDERKRRIEAGPDVCVIEREPRAHRQLEIESRRQHADHRVPAAAQRE